MKTTAAIYTRSSKDRNDVSCTAQEEELRRIAENNGDSVYRVFTDKALSSTRDPRPDFDEMLQLATAKNPPFTKIYCLDTSRSGRDQSESQVILYQLRKRHGIEVIFTNMPNTGSYLDPAFETIFQAFDYMHSQQSKAKGVTGMKQNVKNGYRAGGRPPYGYKIEKIEIAKHKNGEDITKTKLVPDPETAPYAKEYFERRAKYEDRKSILNDFYNRGILSLTGRREWPMGSAKSMEDNVDTYLGHTTFNRLNERLKEKGRFNGYLHGKKYKPREEWVVHENTHEPIISEETANIIREMKAKGIREPSGKAKHVYALSGIMKCSECGTSFTGNGGVYRCNAKNKPGKKCHNNDISSSAAEEAVFAFIGNQLLNFKNSMAVVDRLKKKLDKGTPDLSPLEKMLAEIEQERTRLLNLYKKGLVDIEEIETDLKEIKDQKGAVSKEIENQQSASKASVVSEDQIREAIDNFTERVDKADPQIKKRVVQTLFDEIRLSPKNGDPWERVFEIKGAGLPLTGVNVASPRGFEPLSPA
ncbi:MAG: recombinase family protein [Desulfobacterales bacterium]